MKTFNILFLGTQMAVGGAQKVLLEQAAWFHEHGHRVTVMFIYDKEDLQETWQALYPFPILGLGGWSNRFNGSGNSLRLFHAWVKLWRFLRSERVEVVEAFTHDSNLFALPVAWLAGVPVRIATHHGVIESFPRWLERIHSWMINWQIAHRLVAVSNKIHGIALREGVRPKFVATISNGIKPIPADRYSKPEVRREMEILEDQTLLVAVGRLVQAKAYEVLIAGMPEVVREFPSVRLKIYGEGPLRNDLEALITSLNLDGVVSLEGKTDHVARCLTAADVYILSSRSEGMPIALLEAMSAGLACVATRVAGVDEVLADEEHGRVVPAEDSQALAQAVLFLIRNPEARIAMGAAAKKHFLRLYSIDRMCEEYINLMQDGLPAGNSTGKMKI